MFQPLLAEPLIGIHYKRFQHAVSRRTSLHAGLTELVEYAPIVCSLEILKVDGPAPVVFIVWRAVFVGTLYINAQLVVVEVLVVGHNRDNRQGDISRKEDVRMGGRPWRQIPFAKQLRTYGACGGDGDGIAIDRTGVGGLATIGCVSDDGPLGASFRQREGQRDGRLVGGYPSRFAENGLAEDFGAQGAAVGRGWGGGVLVSPHRGTLRLPPIRDIGSGLFGQVGQFVYDFIMVEKVKGSFP